jgi:hypothetical protein
MSFFTWLRNETSPRASHRPSNHRPGAPRFRPQLEVLEGRDVPSTLKVTTYFDGGPGSLRYEIAQAKSGDTITFDKNLGSPVVYVTNGELVIDKSLTIKGPGAGVLTIEAYAGGGRTSRIFEVDGAGTTVSLSGLTLDAGGGTFSINSFYDQPYDGYGGAVLNFGTLTISNCTLGVPTGSGNFAQNAGGAVANFGTMAVTGSNVFNNRANDGGGIYNNGTMTVTGGHVSVNTANEFGGGIDNLGSLTVNSSTLAYNSAYDGGAIYNAGTATVSGGSVSNNSASDNGGGIYNAGTVAVDGSVQHMKVSECAITGNSANNGGGIYNAVGCTATVSNCGISSNICYADGGGIYNAGDLTVSTSTFNGNKDALPGTPDNIYGPYTDGGGNTFN